MSQITTHVLDTALGKPAQGIEISLSELKNNDWNIIAAGSTNDDGRIAGLLADDVQLKKGRYKLRFETGFYLQQHHGSSFYPFAEIVFEIDGDGQHYHIPLLLQPFGYSTYRGS